MKVEKAEVERRLEQFKQAAKVAGIKLTQQRLDIFREVAASVEHPDAETVFRAVRRRLTTVSLDTVYRTLATLVDLGLLTTLGPRRESIRFDANVGPHHHYVCVRCGLVRDFESATLADLGVPEAVQALGSVIRTNVEVRGVCARCGGAPPPERSQRATSPPKRRGKENR